MPLVQMKAAFVKTDGERLGNEFMNGVFFAAQFPLKHGPDIPICDEKGVCGQDRI